MSIFRALHNNLKYDVWGNYLMARQIGPRAAYGYLAGKSWALAKAVLRNRTIVVNNCEFFDTWS